MTKKASNVRGLMLLSTALLVLTFATATQAAEAAAKSVEAGTNWVLDHSEKYSSLTIAEGASIKAPDGYSVTLTVDGVEKDIKPGTYEGNVVLTLTEDNVVKFGAFASSTPILHYFRQALFLDRTGVNISKSVVAAAGGYVSKGGELNDADIKSEGESFNGIYVADGRYILKNTKLNFEGNGGNDFAGYGAGIMSTGRSTTLIVDNANVSTHGAVRTTVVADKGSNLIVKNSHIEARNGKLPDDYRPNTTPGQMKDVPWMLGLTGNCRATNLLGDNTTATYINSYIASEGWGVLSIDSSTNTKLSVINSKVMITGTSGYGTYSIGNAHNAFYGSSVEIPDYAAIVTGGNVSFAASTPENLAKLNTDLKLGLTPAELSSLPSTQTTVKSKRFGVMIWGNSAADSNTVKITDGTVFDTGETTFVDRGAPAAIDVDGSHGVQLNARNGIILQVMDLDKAPGVMTNGINLTTGVYRDPVQPPVKAKDFDLTAIHKSDVNANFSSITLKGDFYNGISTSSIGGGMPGGPGGAPGGAASGPGGAAGGPGGMPGGPGGGAASASGKNLILKFEKSNITGVITASAAKHAKDTLTSADVLLVSEVKNTPGPAVNNGVIVNLVNSTWTVTGTSYLTSLTIGDGSSVTAPKGSKLTMTVDGVAKPVKTGGYTGAIVLTVKKG
jgi:hypothetical protein